MKKLLGIIILSLLLSGNAYAKEKKISNGLSINIPEGYHYFELTLKQIITRFPSLDINDFQIEGFDLGIGIDAKLVVLSNEKKTINLIDDFSSVTGLAKLENEYYEPLIELFDNPDFLKIVKKYVKKKFPKIERFDDFEELGYIIEDLSEEEMQKIFTKLFEDKRFHKKIDIYIRPFIDKFNSDYKFDKTTVILIADKKLESVDEMNSVSTVEANNFMKELIKVMIKESPKDPNIKFLKKLKYEVAKNNNGNLYLYSNDFEDSVIPKGDMIFTSENKKLFIMFSTCSNKCKSTDFLQIIKPTNIYSKSKKKLKNVVSTSNEVDQLTDNLIEQLNQLNDLYKSGVLTKEEFKKAKKKLLN